MMLRRVTIFGASGFIGRYAVKRLADDGVVVAACARHARDAGYLRPMGDVGQIAPLNIDVTDERALTAAVAGSDAVVNATGILYERGRQTFDALHVRGPASLAAAARAAGVKRFVHISAIAAEADAPS